MAPLRTATAMGVMAAVTDAKVAFDFKRHDIAPVTPQKFDSVIGKFRDTQIALVWLYTPNASHDSGYTETYDEIAKDLKGMARVMAMDCSAHSRFCSDLGHDGSGVHLEVYPTNPMPSYKFGGDSSTVKKVSGHLKKLIPNNVTTFAGLDEFNNFRTVEITKPKVFLFTEKDTPPTLMRALSSDSVFRRTISFGLVSKAQEELVTAFKGRVTTYPSLFLMYGSDQKVEKYKGEMTFDDISAWVNLYSESGVGDKIHSGGSADGASIEESQPWLVEEVPEATAKSFKAVCLKKDGVCVVYVTPNDMLAVDELTMLTEMKRKYEGGEVSGRATVNFNFSWLSASQEPEVAAALGASDGVPTIKGINPKRMRFTSLGEDEQADRAGIASMVAKVTDGDARYKVIKGKQLPAFSVRKAASKAKEEL